MVTIPPDIQATDTVSVGDVTELAEADPSFGKFAKGVRFRRDIWYLEFSFKRPRMIWIDVPQPNGHMRKRLVWYLLYSVTNHGQALTSVKQPDGTYEVEKTEMPVRFVPEFLLSARDPEVSREYPERVLPLAFGPIVARERPGRELFTSVTMPKQEIAVGETRWGVATWDNIDPRVDFFSIYVKGLTNAYRSKDDPETFRRLRRLGAGRDFEQKTLKLNFWRPGDEYDEKESEIQYGVPGQVDYEWVYR